MQGVTRPVGELPPEVYWRRRVVAISLAVLVVIVLFYLIRPLFSSGDPTPTVTETTPGALGAPTVTAAATPDASASRPCEDIDMAVEISPSPRDFAGKSIPLFTVTFVHTGLTACVLTIDDDASLHISSGSDRIWDSADCPGEALIEPRVEVLEPDDEIETSVSWPRVRSNSSCSANLATPRAGTYHAVLTVGSFESNDASFTLSDK